MEEMRLEKKQRNANMDLLRIVSMLLIIFLHSIDHSGVLENAAANGTAMYFYVRFTYAMCMVCVNIYVMLSGYFMVHSQFRLHKLVTLWMEAAFYSFVLKLLFMLSGADGFSVVSLASCFFPILTGRYWFLTIYVGLYLISPFLNILIHAMDRKQHTLLNLCLFAIMSAWSSIHPAIAGMNSGGGWGLAWFVVMYLAAAWFRLYYTPDYKPIKWFAGYLLIPFIISAMQCLSGGDMIGGIVRKVLSHWFRYDSAPVYIMTICLFSAFLNVNIRSSKLSSAITAVSPLTFGVYLIHAHANVSPWSWAVLNLPEKMDSGLFPLIHLGCVFGIFAVCIAIDAVRKKTLGKLESSEKLMQLSDAAGKWFEASVCSLNKGEKK